MRDPADLSPFAGELDAWLASDPVAPLSLCFCFARFILGLEKVFRALRSRVCSLALLHECVCVCVCVCVFLCFYVCLCECKVIT